MKEQHFYLPATDGKRTLLCSGCRRQAGASRGSLQISHGMAEHCLRYQPLAVHLTSQGMRCMRRIIVATATALALAMAGDTTRIRMAGTRWLTICIR